MQSGGKGRDRLDRFAPLPRAIAITLEPTIHTALNHPTRREILRAMHKEPGREVSGVELVREGKVVGPLSIVAYHMRVLRTAEIVEHCETRPKSGANEYFYLPKLAGHAEVEVALGATQADDAASAR